MANTVAVQREEAGRPTGVCPKRRRPPNSEIKAAFETSGWVV
jgi:hypothetical protein